MVNNIGSSYHCEAEFAKRRIVHPPIGNVSWVQTVVRQVSFTLLMTPLGFLSYYDPRRKLLWYSVQRRRLNKCSLFQLLFKIIHNQNRERLLSHLLCTQYHNCFLLGSQQERNPRVVIAIVILLSTRGTAGSDIWYTYLADRPVVRSNHPSDYA